VEKIHIAVRYDNRAHLEERAKNGSIKCVRGLKKGLDKAYP